MLVGMFVFILNIYSIVLIIRALMSWFPNVDYRNPLVRLLFDITEPVLRPIRDLFPPQSGMDFSTMIAIIGISVITMILQTL
ncbi:MAG: YggT family protein [Anaerolineae bacterium]|jgi:YggT family protein|nr:YggT family protein [Anaerolineae bacterium]